MSEQGLTKVRKTKVHKVIVEQVDARSMRRMREAWGAYDAPRLRPGAIHRWLMKQEWVDLIVMEPYLRVPQLRAALEILGNETEGLRRSDLISSLIQITGLEVIDRWPDSEDADFFQNLFDQIEEATSDAADDDEEGDEDFGWAPHEVVLRRALDTRGFDAEMPIPHLLQRIRSWTPEGLDALVAAAAETAREVGKPMCEWFLLKALGAQ